MVVLVRWYPIYVPFTLFGIGHVKTIPFRVRPFHQRFHHGYLPLPPGWRCRLLMPCEDLGRSLELMLLVLRLMHKHVKEGRVIDLFRIIDVCQMDLAG
jgi:hypothetical protein